MPVPIECVLVGLRSVLDVLEKRRNFIENSVLQGCIHFLKNIVATVQNLVAASARRPGFVHP